MAEHMIHKILQRIARDRSEKDLCGSEMGIYRIRCALTEYCKSIQLVVVVSLAR